MNSMEKKKPGSYGWIALQVFLTGCRLLCGDRDCVGPLLSQQ